METSSKQKTTKNLKNKNPRALLIYFAPFVMYIFFRVCARRPVRLLRDYDDGDHDE